MIKLHSTKLSKKACNIEKIFKLNKKLTNSLLVLNGKQAILDYCFDFGLETHEAYIIAESICTTLS